MQTLYWNIQIITSQYVWTCRTVKYKIHWSSFVIKKCHHSKSLLQTLLLTITNYKWKIKYFVVILLSGSVCVLWLLQYWKQKNDDLVTWCHGDEILFWHDAIKLRRWLTVWFILNRSYLSASLFLHTSTTAASSPLPRWPS